LHILRIIQEEAMKENSAAVHAQVPVDVATFLLNEKRADIHSIEARLKVNVVLIPNTNLETPNYKVERLRHDDLNQADVLPASYNLVSAPAEEEKPAQAAQETRPPRQQPVVQGVTPERPAPVAAPASRPARIEPQPVRTDARPAAGPQPGLLGRFFGWLKGETEPQVPRQPAPVQPPRREIRPERQERDRGDRDRFRQRDGRRDQRPGRDENRDGRREGRGDRPHRPDRGDRQPRQDQQHGEQRQPRPERSEQRPHDQQRPPERPAPQSGSERKEGEHERRRRRRGGRDRGDRGGERRDGSVQGSPNRNEEQRQKQPRPYAHPSAIPTAAELASLEATAQEGLPEPGQAPVEARELPAAPAPVKPVPEAPAPREPDPAEIERALHESGLEMVQTRVARPAEPAPESDFIPAKRERRPPPPDINEPLVQVETVRESSEPKD
jgi:ribonuclease E